MTWPLRRPIPRAVRANVAQARADLAAARAQRAEAVRAARKIREATARNNFAANTFKLDPGRKR